METNITDWIMVAITAVYVIGNTYSQKVEILF